MAANAQMTSYVDVTSLTSCQDFCAILCLSLETILDQTQAIDVIFGGTHVCVLLHFGPGVTK